MDEKNFTGSKKYPPDHLRILLHNGHVGRDIIQSKEKIKHVFFGCSVIDSISDEFFGALSDTENLIINGNQKFPKLNKKFFKHFPNLTLIYVNNNDDLDVEIDCYCDLEYLKILALEDLPYEHLSKSIFKGLNLRRLSLVNCKVRDIDADVFNSMSELEELNLSNNNLTGFKPGTFEGLNKLKELLLQKNDMVDLEWAQLNALPSLEFIDVSDNKLTIFDTEKTRIWFPNLKKIALRGNKLSEKDVESLNKKFTELGISEDT